MIKFSHVDYIIFNFFESFNGFSFSYTKALEFNLELTTRPVNDKR